MSNGSGLGWLLAGGLGVVGVGLLWARRASASTKPPTDDVGSTQEPPKEKPRKPIAEAAGAAAPAGQSAPAPTPTTNSTATSSGRWPTTWSSVPAASTSPGTAPPAAEAAPATPGPRWSRRYDARAKRLLDSIPSRIARTRQLIARWPTYLDRYRGGLPRGVFAAIMQMESDGRPQAPGDRRLGEVGLFQITEELPRSLGFDPALRYQNEWNCYLAGREYNEAAARWHKQYPALVPADSKDAWLLARLAFAIGDGGARKHVRRAVKALPEVLRSKGVYAALLALAQQGGARKAGSQSAELVAYRIALCPVNFEIGERAEPGTYGQPMKLSPPRP